jgi:hypothetical protein
MPQQLPSSRDTVAGAFAPEGLAKTAEFLHRMITYSSPQGEPGAWSDAFVG